MKLFLNRFVQNVVPPTREIVGCYVGDRSRKSARKLWGSLPGIYRQCAAAYTDFWQFYKTAIPIDLRLPQLFGLSIAFV